MKVTARLLITAAVVLLVSRLGLADRPSDARTVINKAIQATGGLEVLKKYQAQTWKDTGTYYGMGEGLPYTGEYAIQWPDKFRMEIKDVFVIVLNGDQGWVSAMGKTTEMTKEQLAEQQKSHYCGWVTTLAPLGDTSFKLSLADSGDEGTVGVKVEREGQRDVTLYFDKKTHLLAKSAFIVHPDEQGGKEVLAEYYYKDYKDFGGMKISTTINILHDGKRFVDAKNSDIKPLEKLDDSVFAKP